MELTEEGRGITSCQPPIVKETDGENNRVRELMGGELWPE